MNRSRHTATRQGTRTATTSARPARPATLAYTLRLDDAFRNRVVPPRTSWQGVAGGVAAVAALPVVLWLVEQPTVALAAAAGVVATVTLGAVATLGRRLRRRLPVDLPGDDPDPDPAGPNADRSCNRPTTDRRPTRTRPHLRERPPTCLHRPRTLTRGTLPARPARLVPPTSTRGVLQVDRRTHASSAL